MQADCDEFRKLAGFLLDAENCLTGLDSHKQAGHDFWLTRCGHGCGFWETYDWKPCEGALLTTLCEKFGNVDLHSVDGKVFIF